MKDPASPDAEIRWAAMLRGHFIANPTFLCSKGQRGICIAYKAAVEICRKVYVCPLFRKQSPGLADVVDLAIASDRSNWSPIRPRTWPPHSCSDHDLV